MRQLSRPAPLGALLGLLVLAAVASNHLLGDYGPQARGMDALLHGRVRDAVGALGPVYLPSFLLRFPGALLAHLLGAGRLGVYHAGGIEGLGALAGVGWLLAARARTRGAEPAVVLTGALLVGGCPLVLHAMAYGHPEEALGAALCIAAVLAAGSARPVLAGVLLAAAVANKTWALAAIGPVIVALPHGRARFSAVAGGLTAAVAGLAWVLYVLVLHQGVRSGAGELVPFAGPWRAQNLFFWLGHEVHHVSGGVTYTNYRGPHWYLSISHGLAIGAAAGLSVVVARRRHGIGPALGVLAVAFLLRCAVDPWNVAYYAIPAVAAFAAWELETSDRLPTLAALALAGTWLSFDGADRLDLGGPARFVLYSGFVGVVLTGAARRLGAFRLAADGTGRPVRAAAGPVRP